MRQSDPLMWLPVKMDVPVKIDVQPHHIQRMDMVSFNCLRRKCPSQREATFLVLSHRPIACLQAYVFAEWGWSTSPSFCGWVRRFLTSSPHHSACKSVATEAESGYTFESLGSFRKRSLSRFKE